MPVYEYQCRKCSKIHEIWQKISDTPPDKCTACGGPLHKLVSLSSFQLKGGGWYVDGYSNSPKKEKSEKESVDTEKSSPKDKNIKKPEKESNTGPKASEKAA